MQVLTYTHTRTHTHTPTYTFAHTYIHIPPCGSSSKFTSNEEDNASVVAKITTGGGEADAAIVYTSDVSDAAGNDVNAVAIPEDVNVIATYPIAVVEEAPNADVAADFVAYVVGSEGQATLKDYGFEPLA